MNWRIAVAVIAAAGGALAIQQLVTTNPNPRDVAYHYAQDVGAATVCYDEPVDISSDEATIHVRLTWPNGVVKASTFVVAKSGRSFVLADNWKLANVLPGEGLSQDKKCSNVSTPAINLGLNTP